MLNKNIFRSIADKYNLHDSIDMFSSRLNNQLRRYVSYLRDPNAFAVDAFSMTLTNECVYLFPPFSVLGQILQEIERDQAEAVLVAPLWPTQM